MKQFDPSAILVLYGVQFYFAGPHKFKNYNTNKPRIFLHQIGEIVEQDALMPPNMCGRLEELVVVSVCVVW